MIQLDIPDSWKPDLKNEVEKPYFKNLIDFIDLEYRTTTVYPKQEAVFNALAHTALKDLRVILIGQDPYHGINQAHGLSFSVQAETKIPPSLKNIFKEIQTDLGFPMPSSGNLTPWAKQGVLLLNATLTVREGLPGSHQNKGWETFTDAIIKLISDEKKDCVFLLWGIFAKTKANLIDGSKHLILEAAHPSPLARGAFFGCKHFSKTNEYLVSKNKEPIAWDLNESNLFSNQKG